MSPRRRPLDREPVAGQRRRWRRPGCGGSGRTTAARATERVAAALRACPVRPAPRRRRSRSPGRAGAARSRPAARRNAPASIVTGPPVRPWPGASCSRRGARRRLSSAASARAARRASRASRSARQSLARERGHQRAQPRPGEARIAVRRIVGVGDLRGLERRDQPRLRRCAAAGGPARCHRRSSHGIGAASSMPAETRDAAAARQPEQHGLGLVVERVRGEHVARAGLARRIGEQAIARLRAPPPGCRSSASCRSSAGCGARRRACARAWRRLAPRACDSGRRPWSTVTATSFGPRLSALRQRAASQSSAVESGPPETARSRTGMSAKKPRSSLASAAETGRLVSSGHASAPARRPASRCSTRADICGSTSAKRRAGHLLLLERRQRLAEPQQRVRRLGVRAVLGGDGEELLGRRVVALALEQAFAEPELRVGRAAGRSDISSGSV